MATDPFVAPKLEDKPRQHQNLAPGVSYPAAEHWRANRPGDLPTGQPTGMLLGSPGPNVGYALKLARDRKDRLHLEGEELDDVVSVIAGIAMRRASELSRAPVVSDVDFAIRLLGYERELTEHVFEWRRLVVGGAAHDYVTRRTVVDAVPKSLLRLKPDEVGDKVAAFHEALRAAWQQEHVTTDGEGGDTLTHAVTVDEVTDAP